MDWFYPGKLPLKLLKQESIDLPPLVRPVRSRLHPRLGRRPHLRHGLRQTTAGPRKRIAGCCDLPYRGVQGILAVLTLPGHCYWGTSRLNMHWAATRRTVT